MPPSTDGGIFLNYIFCRDVGYNLAYICKKPNSDEARRNLLRSVQKLKPTRVQVNGIKDMINLKQRFEIFRLMAKDFIVDSVEVSDFDAVNEQHQENKEFAREREAKYPMATLGAIRYDADGATFVALKDYTFLWESTPTRGTLHVASQEVAEFCRNPTFFGLQAGEVEIEKNDSIYYVISKSQKRRLSVTLMEDSIRVTEDSLRYRAEIREAAQAEVRADLPDLTEKEFKTYWQLRCQFKRELGPLLNGWTDGQVTALLQIEEIWSGSNRSMEKALDKFGDEKVSNVLKQLSCPRAASFLHMIKEVLGPRAVSIS